jgi:hypothetical protein
MNDWKLIRLMISEEHRLNAALIGGVQFLLFPFMIMFMAFVLAVASGQLLKNMPWERAYTLLHLVVLIYGFSVGGFALFGSRIAERRFGGVTVLLQMPVIHPISFRRIFTAFYLKDLLYYFLYTLVPLVAGIALSIPLTHFPVTGVLFLLLTLTLSFLLGISFAFFLSSMYVRSKAALAAVLLAVLLYLAAGWTGGWYDPVALIPSIALQRTHDMWWALLAFLTFLAFSTVALLTLQVKFAQKSESYDAEIIPTVKRFAFGKRYANLLGKDWIDLRRSGSLVPVSTAYVGPLIFLALIFWFVGDVLDVRLDVNLIFYAAMIGFFSVSIYAWLDMLDAPGSLEVLPLKVADAVRSKLLMLSLFAAALSTGALILLSLFLGEMTMLAAALPVAYATTAYTVAATAYLTGLRTNSYLFDPRVLGKFSVMVIPPLVLLVILSFSYANSTLVLPLIWALCALLALAAWFFYRRIEGRWGRASFVH